MEAQKQSPLFADDFKTLDDELLNHRVTWRRNALQNQRNDAQFVRLELQISCTVRLSYHAYVIYVILGDVLTFVLTPVVHRSPLECRLPMKNRQWWKGWDLSDVLPFGRL